MQWRTVTQSNDTRFLVRGTELASALVPYVHFRYQISEVRTYDRTNPFPHGRRYAVRDAATVSDADVRAGKRSQIVAWFDDEAAALNWCWFGL